MRREMRRYVAVGHYVVMLFINNTASGRICRRFLRYIIHTLTRHTLKIQMLRLGPPYENGPLWIIRRPMPHR